MLPFLAEVCRTRCSGVESQTRGIGIPFGMANTYAIQILELLLSFYKSAFLTHPSSLPASLPLQISAQAFLSPAWPCWPQDKTGSILRVKWAQLWLVGSVNDSWNTFAMKNSPGQFITAERILRGTVVWRKIKEWVSACVFVTETCRLPSCHGIFL